ncbi:hypothetical protein FOMG_15074 [Fusarium oxysporum f. sp. melonis 26406]|uniref:Nephrocystin 3-like N-terminal domain-containing protein n=1 Tax=Fusarium oxysporum f. sp. melonis 26406 TaxID=1089452 RepID=W9ZB73_FUSOX|nr:hypothetical protein FOMG_15074 [Fusarium oxysporum f. sp. melonis 26406]
MAASSHKNFRLRGIPLECETRGEACSLIQKTLALEPNASPTVYSLACSPTDPNSKIATLSFPSIPDCLSDRSRVEWNFDLSEDNEIDFGRSLSFDTHFIGFTPFHRTSDKDCHIDVIAVCGLGGHALGSFKEKNGRFVWLRDALPSDMPNARILTYGYNSRLVGNQPRSILFIGHSLGGLVVKETVRILKEEPLGSDLAILNAIAGFAFFGVPHRGLAVECLVPLVKDNPNRALLESLSKNSSLLERLQIEFDKISKARRLSVVSFYETEKSPTATWINGKWEMSGPSEVLVEVFSATCGCQKQHPINRNHSEMVKYSGVHDQLYRRVLVALRPILGISRGRPGTAGIGAGLQVYARLSSDELDCLKSLSFPEQEHRYSEISYANDTCDWLLEDQKYQTWMNESRGIFWIKGCPGTGKSVLMKFAVDMMERRKCEELVVSFFIHGRGVPLQRTALGMLRALLSLLLKSFPKYLSELMERFQDQQQRYGSYEQKGGWRWNEKELEAFLARLLINGTKHQPVVIFVDALDECGEEDAKRLLAYFKDIMSDSECKGSCVKICFSSRHFPILGHEIMPSIYVEQRNDNDIRLVVENRLKDIKPGRKRRQIENEISLKAHGGFQWAVLISNMIRDQDMTGGRTEDLLNTISSIPPGLEELYRIILQDENDDQQKQMTKLFQWILFAKRPLSAQELREALATDKDMAYATVSELRSRGNWSDNVCQFEMRVRYISRGLVEFRDRDVYEQYEPGGEEWSREAQFIHQSAADFVAQKFLPGFGDGQNPIPRSPDGIGHYEISRSFLNYLTLEEILKGESLPRKQLSAAFPLLPYGTAFLLSHIMEVEVEGIPQTDLVALIQWGRPERLRMVARIWRKMDPESTHAPRGWPFLGSTALHLAVAFGSAQLLDTLLQKDNSDLNARDLEGNTPLQLALRENFQELAVMILDRSRTWQIEYDTATSPGWPGGPGVPGKYLSHINATNNDGDTPLGLAVSIRADNLIRSLIDAGAEIKHEKSLVFYAISQENKTLVHQLIKDGSDLDGAVFFATQCLCRAKGDTHSLYELVGDLLKAGGDTWRFSGVEINSFNDDDDDDEEDEEAIFVASRGGETALVDLLLSHGSSATLRGQGHAVPILLAIENGSPTTAIVLFRNSPETIFSKDANGMTAFELILRTAQVDLALKLVKEGGEVLTLQMLFYRAVKMKHLQFVEALLRRDNNVIQLANIYWKGGEAPFLIAIHGEDYRMVRLLLRTSKVGIRVRDLYGNTPFFVAVQLGYLDIAKLLFEEGKFVVDQEEFEERADSAESIGEEYQDMCMSVFPSGSGVYRVIRRPNRLRECLWWAVKRGELRMMKLLLNESKVDANQHDDEGQTPLSWAIEKGREDIVKILLSSNRVDVRARDKTGQTACWWALETRNDRMIQLLLGSELFYIHAEDDETGRKLFWWAVGKGNIGVIKMLHDSGKYDINSRDPSGRTPLIYAAETCAEEAMRVLLKIGKADIHAVDNRGDTALSIAVKRGWRTIVDLLSSYKDTSSGIAIRVV